MPDAASPFAPLPQRALPAPPSLSARQPGPGPALEAADEDAVLVQRCRQGDGRAWALLVQRYQRLVNTVGLRAGLDDAGAADVFQTVYTRLLLQLPRLAQPQRLRAWLVTTAKREALLQRRLAQRCVPLAPPGSEPEPGMAWLPEPADEQPIAEDQLAQRQQLQRLRQALGRLDERSRALLELLFADHDTPLPYEEVARRMGMPVGSIGPTRARCLDKLRRLLA